MPLYGFKKSRALWDNARRPHPTKNEKMMSLFRAILYEMQPFRIGDINASVYKENILKMVKGIGNFLSVTVPSSARSMLRFVSQLEKRHWMMMAAAGIFYFLVRTIHEVLEAGPIVIIITLLIGIFTIGLSDEERDGLSAYSVFNNGFQKIMGSVDAEELLAQHVGGGMVGGVGRGQPRDEVEPILPPVVPRNEVRQQPPDDGDIDVDGQALPAENNNQNIRQGRRSGKKGRRRNHQQHREQREEIRRQQDAARALGFGGDDEAFAMNRLIEEQGLAAG